MKSDDPVKAKEDNKVCTNLQIQLKHTRTTRIFLKSEWGSQLFQTLIRWSFEQHLKMTLKKCNCVYNSWMATKTISTKQVVKETLLRQTGITCNAAQPFHVKSVTHRRGLCQFKSSDRDGCLPTDIPGCGMSAHTKTRAKQASTEAFVALDEGKRGEGGSKQTRGAFWTSSFGGGHMSLCHPAAH